MKTFLKHNILPSIVIALCGVGAHAQQATTTPPTNVGVNPATAAEANDRAVPKNDVGTVVRTGPSAADKVRDATSRDSSTAPGSSGVNSTADTAQPMRKPIADRN